VVAVIVPSLIVMAVVVTGMRIVSGMFVIVRLPIDVMMPLSATPGSVLRRAIASLVRVVDAVVHNGALVCAFLVMVFMLHLPLLTNQD
jgi:hypothetical protein